MHLRRIFRTPLKKYAMDSPVTTLLALAIGAGVLIPLADRTANALPAGFFFLQVQDGSNRVMDSQNSAGQVTGFVHAATPVMGKDSQLWKERFPTVGTIGVIRLENKATGQCLAEDADLSAERVRIEPCGVERTLWHRISQGPSKVALQRTFTVHPTPLPSVNFLSYPGLPPSDSSGFVLLVTTGVDVLPSFLVWAATLQPTGSVASPLTPGTPGTPPISPLTPTSCRTTGGFCGIFTIDCNPLSANDDIFVSGDAFVQVTGVEFWLGKIVGNYLNEGKFSIKVCAVKSGMVTCSDSIPDVTFGPPVCLHRPVPPNPCPQGTIECLGVCRPPTPECFLR